MCSENGAGPTRDELDIEFLGNRTGQPYLIQTNVYKNGTGNREMRHQLWFDPTEDFHSYSILWNSHQILFVDLAGFKAWKQHFHTWWMVLVHTHAFPTPTRHEKIPQRKLWFLQLRDMQLFLMTT
ncbi:unnamed protein product [Camellia sinensis]